MDHPLAPRTALQLPWRLARPIAQWWATRRLAHQFLIAAAIVLVPAMAYTGWWVSGRIVEAVTENTAHAAALYMGVSVAPLIQELATSDELSPETQQRLSRLLADSAIRERVISMKIWRLDGTILYSAWPEMIGKRFPLSESFLRAAAGGLGAEFDSEPHQEDRHERAAGKPLLEIYAPVRAQNSQQVIAVAEFYADGEKLEADIRQATLLSSLVMATVTLLMLGALSGIVYRGSQTIDRQRIQLTSQIGRLHELLGQNEEFRVRLQKSNNDIADMNERILQRIGADLHDGPAQHLSYALLRLNKFAPIIEQGGGEKAAEELKRMREALRRTLLEVRNLSEGLALPELGNATLRQTIYQAVASHEQNTNSKVAVEIDASLPDEAAHSLKVCVYRFIQEGLANAFRHAGGDGQLVTAHAREGLLLSVSDRGPGLLAHSTKKKGLGLPGLRARVEALGGHLSIESGARTGTRLIARFDLKGK